MTTGSSWAGASEHVKVYVRLRPPNERELLATESSTTSSSQSSQGQQSPTSIQTQSPNHIIAGSGYKSETFTYDCVGGEETSQEQVFNDVGKSIVEQCVKGYNGTIFAYGQTGSGKTYTMQGPTNMANLSDHQERVFELIAQEEQRESSVKYLCKASYIEIYNESIFDLLDNSATARATREDIKRGVYVDGVTEESIHNPTDAYKMFELGASNRHTYATSMNRESSRSHTVLTLTIQSMSLSDGINHIRESRFNLVDLAGSERQKQANTEGMRLKEAANINRSLLCLGSVINALGEIASGHSRHVHYRDSRLTFLLKDSLGGNSNTFIVANISPSSLCYQETMSTLRFAQRAKMIKNKAVVNEDIQGNVNELQVEIQRLKAELEVERTSGGGHVSTITTRTYLETLGRLREEQALHAAEIAKCSLLEEAIKAREKQYQSSQLVVKFKESALASHRKGDTNAAIHSENKALVEEIASLKRQLDYHPEVLKVSAELAKHVELLKAYERFQADRENYEERQKQNKMYFEDLAAKIVELGEENEALRARLGSGTPKTVEMEDIDFPRADGIDDLMKESPPKIRDEDRRFSSDMKSLLQRVAQTRQAEYRRLSGNLRTPDKNGSPLGVVSTPTKLSEDKDETMMGINLSESLSATSNMDINDSPTEVLLKRDIERMTDQYAVLERRYDEAQFELVAMEQSLSMANQDTEAKQKMWNAEREESVKVLRMMEQASVDMEQELSKTKAKSIEVEQLLQTANRDLEETRQKLIDNQREYDTQVQYNITRNKEFQEKESRWEETKSELVKAKEEAEALLGKEKSRILGTQSELEKELLTLAQECDSLMSEKKQLEGLELSLKNELEKLAQAGAQAVQEHTIELETERTAKTELQERLRVTQERVDSLAAECVTMKQDLESKSLEASRTLQEREQVLESKVNLLEARLVDDLKECESRLLAEAEEKRIALQRSLLEKHEQEIQVLRVESEEQGRALVEAKASLKESVEAAEQVLKAKQLLQDELTATKNLYSAMISETESLKQDKIRVENQIENVQSKCAMLEKSLDDHKLDLSELKSQTQHDQQELTSLKSQLQKDQLELNSAKLQLQHDQWEKDRLETAKSELKTQVLDLVRKINETERKLEESRDQERTVQMEFRTVQDELEHQLNQVRNELTIKTNENVLNEEYKRKFRELRSQFADLAPKLSQRQKEGFHEREVKRVMEMEKMKQEIDQAQTRATQLEANLSLAQEMNEQALKDSKSNMVKIAEEMDKRLMEVETQLQSAEQEVKQALDTVQQKTKELQELTEEAMNRKETIQTLENELGDERAKVEKLELSLAQQQEQLKTEEQGANAILERQQEQLALEAKQKLKEEQMLAHQKMLHRLKEEQQLIAQQDVQRREKAQVIFEGLTTENGKLREQVQDLANVTDSMMKHKNQKQKLQYHVKIKQQNNELRTENQRLMFRAIELEEKLGNKDNVASLRKQVKEMHGTSPYQVSPEYGFTGLDDEADMELVQGLEIGLIQRANSSSPPLSSEASTSPVPTSCNEPLEHAPISVGAGQKRKATTNDLLPAARHATLSSTTSSSAAPNLESSRKRQAPGLPAISAPLPVHRQRIISGSSASTSTSARSAPESAAETQLGPRARAKAAADAAMAAAKGGRRQGTPATTTRSVASSSSSTTSMASKVPFQRVSSSSSLRSKSTSKDDPLRGSRAGGGVTKPRQPLTTSTARTATSVKTKGSEHLETAGTKVIKTDSSSSVAQKAREREARIAAATAALQSNQSGHRAGTIRGAVVKTAVKEPKNRESSEPTSNQGSSMSPTPARSRSSSRHTSSSPHKKMTINKITPDPDANVAVETDTTTTSGIVQNSETDHAEPKQSSELEPQTVDTTTT
ncbi:Kinesin-like protein kif15 [Gryganskiella cystojenkinii]|nr:Kinesin-like protein kif15 [Gryganskiella cystojenkinii]